MSNLTDYILGNDVLTMGNLLDKTFLDGTPEDEIVTKGLTQLITRSMLTGVFCVCLGLFILLIMILVTPHVFVLFS
jgi:hypothetical protein